MVKVRITAATEVILRLALIALVTFELGEVVIHLAQPCGVRRLVDVFDAPCQFLTSGLSLPKKAREFRVDDPSDPVHDENLAPRQLLGPLKDRDRVLNVSIPAPERQRRSMLRPQQADDAQIKRLLNGRQTPLEFFAAGRKEFRSFALPVGTYVLRQQQEHQL